MQVPFILIVGLTFQSVHMRLVYLKLLKINVVLPGDKYRPNPVRRWSCGDWLTTESDLAWLL